MEVREHSERREAPEAQTGAEHGPLRRVAWALLAGTVVNWLFNVANRRLGRPWPYSSFLFHKNDRYGDFLRVVQVLGAQGAWPEPPDDRFGILHMPPPVLVGYQLCAKLVNLTGSPRLVFWTLQVAWVALFLGALGFGLRKVRIADRAWVGLAFLLSYPTLFTIDRGNIAGLVCAFIAWGVVLALDGRSPWATSAALALAALGKVTPVVFLAPLRPPFTRQNWKELLRVAALGLPVLALTTWAVAAFLDGYRLDAVRFDLQRYRDYYVLGNLSVPYGSSLLNLAKLPFFPPVPPPVLTTLYAVSVVGLPAGTLGVSWLSFRQRLSLFDAMALTAMLFVVLTPAVGDYYLLALFVPLLLLPRALPRPSQVLVVGLVLTLIPKHYAFPEDISLQSLLNPAFLVVSLAVYPLLRWRAAPAPVS